MKLKYSGQQKGFNYQEQEDAFLIYSIFRFRHGYGAARRIQLEIRCAWQFHFNRFFKSRSPQEIQKRCEVLIRVVEKEVQDHHEKEASKEKGQSSTDVRVSEKNQDIYHKQQTNYRVRFN